MIILVKIIEKYDQKLITCTWNIQNTLTTSWFVITILYKRVPKSLSSMQSHSKPNQSQNEVHTTCWTLLFSCYRYRSGTFLNTLYWNDEVYRLFIRSHLLIWMQVRFGSWQLGPNTLTYRVLTQVISCGIRKYNYFSENYRKI